MRPVLLLVACSAVAAVSLACGPDCADPDVKVTLSVASEEVRALPLLASGKLKLLEVDVPESHGNEAVTITVEGKDGVSIDSIEFTEEINGVAKTIERTRTMLNDKDFADTDTAASGDTLRFFWRTKQLDELALTEGQSHKGRVKVSWRSVGCRTQTGVAELEIPGTIKPVSAAKNFVLQSAEADRLQTVGGAKVKMTLKGNAPAGDFLKNIDAPTYTVVFFSQGLPPIIGYGKVEKSNVAMRVMSKPLVMRTLQSSETMDVFTSNDASGAAPYEHAGTAAATQALVGGGRAVVTLKINSERGQSQTGIPVTDTITTLVDVP